MNDKYKPGAENVPSRSRAYDDPLPILIIVYDLSTDEPVVEKRLDYSKLEDRKYLGKLTFWAITNHHTIETIAVADAEAATKNG